MSEASKRAVIYARVSTKEQKKGYSLDNQIKDCQRYADQCELNVIDTIQDDISGTTPLDERPGGCQLTELINSGQHVDALIVWQLDRLSRPPEGEYSRLMTTIEHLARKGIHVRVIDCHTLKPLDIDLILKAADETGAIVTAENNVFYGGLGSAVAEVLVENLPIPMKRIGVRDTFAESGPYLDLLEKYGLSANHIIKAAEDVLERKS